MLRWDPRPGRTASSVGWHCPPSGREGWWGAWSVSCLPFTLCACLQRLELCLFCLSPGRELVGTHRGSQAGTGGDQAGRGTERGPWTAPRAESSWAARLAIWSCSRLLMCKVLIHSGLFNQRPSPGPVCLVFVRFIYCHRCHPCTT